MRHAKPVVLQLFSRGFKQKAAARIKNRPRLPAVNESSDSEGDIASAIGTECGRTLFARKRRYSAASIPCGDR